MNSVTNSPYSATSSRANSATKKPKKKSAGKKTTKPSPKSKAPTEAALSITFPHKDKERHAYVTLLTDDSYLAGVQVMHYSLRRVSSLPLVILVLNDKKRVHLATIKQLEKLSNVVIKKVPPISNHHEEKKGDDETKTEVPSWFGSAYTKLHIFTLFEYTQVLYIDADCLIVADNLDSIFAELHEVDFGAAPDVFPPDHFNAGVLLVKPSLKVFDALLTLTKS